MQTAGQTGVCSDIQPLYEYTCSDIVDCMQMPTHVYLDRCWTWTDPINASGCTKKAPVYSIHMIIVYHAHTCDFVNLRCRYMHISVCRLNKVLSLLVNYEIT